MEVVEMNYPKIGYTKMVPKMPMKGWHRAKILKITDGKYVSTNKIQSPTVIVNFATEDYSGVSQSYLVGDDFDYKFNKLVACTLKSKTWDFDAMIGKKVEILVEHKLYKGKNYANVVDVR